jgi:hypothetical protein
VGFGGALSVEEAASSALVWAGDCGLSGFPVVEAGNAVFERTGGKVLIEANDVAVLVPVVW